MKKTIEFTPGLFYHEVLKANSDGILFRDAEDRLYFIDKMRKFILPCCELWAYVVLGNHVHLLIRPHRKEVLARLPLKLHLLRLNLHSEKLKDYLLPEREIDLPLAISPYRGSIHFQIRYCIRGLKHSYDQYLKRKYETKGVLWSREKFTKELPTLEDISRTILYIHKNPVFHGMVHQPEDWPFSSFHEITGDSNKLVMRSEILALFKGMKPFCAEHLALPEEYGSKPSKQGVGLKF